MDVENPCQVLNLSFNTLHMYNHPISCALSSHIKRVTFAGFTVMARLRVYIYIFTLRHYLTYCCSRWNNLSTYSVLLINRAGRCRNLLSLQTPAPPWATRRACGNSTMTGPPFPATPGPTWSASAGAPTSGWTRPPGAQPSSMGTESTWRETRRSAERAAS